MSWWDDIGLSGALEDDSDDVFGIGSLAYSPRPAPKLVRAGHRSTELKYKKSSVSAKDIVAPAAKPLTTPTPIVKAPAKTLQQTQTLTNAAAALARAKTPQQQQVAIAIATKVGYTPQQVRQVAAKTPVGKRGIGLDGFLGDIFGGLAGGGGDQGTSDNPTPGSVGGGTDADVNGVPIDYVPKSSAWVAVGSDGMNYAYPAIDMSSAKNKNYVLAPGNPFEKAVAYKILDTKVPEKGLGDNQGQLNAVAGIIDGIEKTGWKFIGLQDTPQKFDPKTYRPLKKDQFGPNYNGGITHFVFTKPAKSVNEAMFRGDDLRWDRHPPTGAFLVMTKVGTGAQWSKVPADFWSVDSSDGQAVWFDILNPVNLDLLDQLQATDPQTALNKLLSAAGGPQPVKGLGFITIYDNLAGLPAGVPQDSTIDSDSGYLFSQSTGKYYDSVSGKVVKYNPPAAPEQYDPYQNTTQQYDHNLDQYDPYQNAPQQFDPYQYGPQGGQFYIPSPADAGYGPQTSPPQGAPASAYQGLVTGDYSMPIPNDDGSDLMNHGAPSDVPGPLQDYSQGDSFDDQYGDGSEDFSTEDDGSGGYSWD